MTDTDTLNNIISKLDNIQSLERVRNGKIKIDIKAITKSVYDFTKAQSRTKTNALPELVTKDFDEEQIWQQVELQNEDEITRHFNGVSKVLNSKQSRIPLCPTKPESMQIKNDELTHEDDGMSDDGDSENEFKNSLKKKKTKQKKRSSIVDDKFFKLQELDEYLNKEERKEEQDDAESDDESVDLFNDFSEEEDEDSEKNYLKYADFFDSPESDNERYEGDKNSDHDLDDSQEEGSGKDEDEEASDGETDENERKDKRVRFNLTNDSDETDSLDNKGNQEKQHVNVNEKADTAGPKSNLEARQERLLTRIKELEEKAIGEKPWQLKGEVSGLDRPQNSLLEEFVEFDVTTRPAPVITEKTTIKLEDIIKQRIKDKAWDDVEKKFKPVETPLEYKKKLVLDQEKSKESLSQIYEKEYLKQKKALDPENDESKVQTSELHNEVRQLMRSLMYKLDALSNYHYTPKRAKPEIKIISNMPAINMEEVAPVATSDAVLLAPEEVKAKLRGDLIGKPERTKTDMKRERRRKKMKQQAKQQMAEERNKLKALTPGIAKKYKNKTENAALVKKLTKDRKITMMDETTQKVARSSTAFFAKLQNQAQTVSKTKKEHNKALSAVKLKL